MSGSETGFLFNPTSISFTYNDIINSNRVFNFELDTMKIECRYKKSKQQEDKNQEKK